MQSGVSDSQYFQASNIFKNKLKIDFVTIKGSNEAVNSIRDNLLKVIIQMAD